MRLLLAVDWPPLVDGLLVKASACVASSYLGAVAIARLDARRAGVPAEPASEQA